MRVVVKSNEPISGDVTKKIMDIFAESECPFESLKNTFGANVTFDGETVRLGTGDTYRSFFEVGRKIYAKKNL